MRVLTLPHTTRTSLSNLFYLRQACSQECLEHNGRDMSALFGLSVRILVTFMHWSVSNRYYVGGSNKGEGGELKTIIPGRMFVKQSLMTRKLVRTIA